MHPAPDHPRFALYYPTKIIIDLPREKCLIIPQSRIKKSSVLKLLASLGYKVCPFLIS